MAQMPTKRMGPPPGASPPMRMTASWSGSERTYRIQVCGAKMRPNGELPSDQYAARRTSDTGTSKKGPSPAHRPSACSGVKALRNTSVAKAASRQAPLAFRSLDPFRALREPGCRRRDEKRPSPLRTKNSQHNPKQPLDRKNPIQVMYEPALTLFAMTLRTRFGQVCPGRPLRGPLLLS
jgi:hypothetical protein